MNREKLKQIVDDAIKLGKEDNEGAHYKEDGLYLSLIREFCPDWVKEEVDRLDKADFTRWYA